ncbi:MAG TPA: formate dehydrogenase accessory sulfurtransferase FdhD [Chthonomonadaceae bacterium]|nr:formate dehydrogenase accessory sulfurtransferase FdhD [Chthonomonadaceae bacterium]
MQAEVPITRWEGDTARESVDSVVVEEPLEIRINGESLTVTMRTPGDDFALAAGLLFTEGIIRSADDIGGMAYCTDPDNPHLQNIVNVYLAGDWRPDQERGRWQRSFMATSSCGLCGKASIEAVRCFAPPIAASDFRVSVGVVRCLSERMRAAQRVFARTGGLHAAGLFDQEGALLVLREDVGRHNAVDKLLGAELLAERIPLSERILMVSGRTSFEIMQKAAVAGAPVVCAVSAPSSLAVQLARELNMTLIGFLRGDTMNVYAGAERVYSGA